MKLLSLDSDLWERYTGAYGSVREDVALLMGEAPFAPQASPRRPAPEQDAERAAFENLCENLSHQMSFHPAIYLALPYMVKLLSRKAEDFSWQLPIFTEAGICLATDVPWAHEGEVLPPQEVLNSYREAVAVLACEAERFLAGKRKQLRKEDVFARRRFFLGLLALLGDRREAFALVMNRFETCYVQCKSCGYLDEDLELIDGKQRRKLHPIRFWQRTQAETFRRFRRILHTLGDWEGEELLACYYGRYVCPACGGKESAMEGLIAAFDPDFDPPAPVSGGGAIPPSPKMPQENPAVSDAGPSELLEDNALRRVDALCRESWPEAMSLLDQGRFQEAAAWCARRLKRETDWRLHVLRACCYKALRKTPELDRCLTAALELDPDNILLLRARCPTLSTADRYRRHVRDLTRLMELDPDHTGTYLLNRAYRLHWTGDDEGARRDLLAAEESPEGRILRDSPDFRRLQKKLFPGGEEA